jgi:glycosyltransferase involved in cell wall biosynthesis
MNTLSRNPLVSVIIPAYKQAEYLADAIRSVLDQTYTNLEAIVVDDCSPDHSAEVVSSFSDTRLRYIRHDQNRMLAAARNTGMRAAQGEVFALLDADDKFDKHKLAAHVDYMVAHEDVGVTYNSRYALRCGGDSVAYMVRSPAAVTLKDLVQGFPFTPSDMVLRRDWAYSVDLFDESLVHFSEDLDINCRLALAGCKFAGIDRALNYRRLHSAGRIRTIRQRLDAALGVLDKIFSDPRMPLEVHALKGRSQASNCIVWATEALRQEETCMGLEFLRQAVEYNPAVLDGAPNAITHFLTYDAIYDEKQHHPDIYRRVIAQLSDEYDAVRRQAQWGIARGWLIKAYRSWIWQSVPAGRTFLKEAVAAGASFDDPFMREVVHELLAFENEYGSEAADAIAVAIDADLRSIVPDRRVPSFAAVLQLGRAFSSYEAGLYAGVPKHVLRAIRFDSRHVRNRGALAIFVKSAWQQVH